MAVVHIGANPQNAAPLHRFKAVLDDIVKGLLHLIAIDLHERQIGAGLAFNHDVARLNLRGKEMQRFGDDGVDVCRLQLRLRGSNGAQELGYD